MGPNCYLKTMFGIAVTLTLLNLSFCQLFQSDVTQKVNVVGIFETNTVSSAETETTKQIFTKAIEYVAWDEQLGNEANPILHGNRIDVKEYDAFGLRKSICEQLRIMNISTAIGLSSKPLRDYMYVLSMKTELPYLELMPSDDYSQESVIHLHPSPIELVELIKRLIIKWEWEHVFFVYEDNYEFKVHGTSALDRYLGLMTMHIKDNVKVTTHQLDVNTDFTQTLDYLKKIFKELKMDMKRVVVDCSLEQIPRFLNRALEMQMLTTKYHYHFASLDLHVLELAHYSFGGANITWGQLVNRTGRDDSEQGVGSTNFERYVRQTGTTEPSANVKSEFFTTHNALLWDGLVLLARGIKERLKKENGKFTPASIDCETETRWNDGFGLRNIIKQQAGDDFMTGNLEFDTTGRRIKYTITLMSLQASGFISRIGEYSKEGGIEMKEPETVEPVVPYDDDWRTRVLNITTINLKPFFFKKSVMNGEALKGNDRYDGYIVDLMKKISEQIPEVKYQFVPQPKNLYGKREGEGVETFNGMVGDVYHRRADMAVGPLTINSDRSEAIHFTKPFMTFGIAILFRKPEKRPPNLLSFSEPITNSVWITILASLVVVSLCMYILGRFSPTEWENPFPCQEDYLFMENQFNLSNVFWFSIGSFMQQGCDIMPRGPSTRIVAVAWWAFTLIIISSYTANLAAFLTITTLSETFKNAEQLFDQTEIRYGCKQDGNTCDFFKKSDIALYKDMWGRMNSTPGALVPEEEVGIQKVKDKGYAFLMESPLLQYEVVTDPECELQQVGPVLNSLSYGIALRKKSPLRDLLSSVILLLNENQVLLELYNKWWKVDDNKCAIKSGGSDDLKLELQNLEGVFVFLVGGLALAVLILLIEICSYTIRKSKSEKRSCCSVLGEWVKSSVKGTFPNSSSLDDIISHSSRRTSNTNIKLRTDEEEPLNNGHPPQIAGSRTTDTFI